MSGKLEVRSGAAAVFEAGRRGLIDLSSAPGRDDRQRDPGGQDVRDLVRQPLREQQRHLHQQGPRQQQGRPPAPPRRQQQRFLKRHARTHHDALRARERVAVETAQEQGDIGQLPLHRSQCGWLFAAVSHSHLDAAPRQKTRTGQPGDAEADHQGTRVLERIRIHVVCRGLHRSSVTTTPAPRR